MLLNYLLTVCFCVCLNGNAQSQDCSKGTIPVYGAGSESAFGAYQTIGSTYVADRSQIRTVDFAYVRSNSQKGISQVINNDRNGTIFAASEVAFNATEKQLYPKMLQVPVVAEALTILFNLPESDYLNLTLQTIADIYLGKITKWNHVNLKMLNPGIELPNETILPVVRQDGGSGETFVFTTALSKISSEWNSKYGVFYNPLFLNNNKCCNSTAWPKNLISFYGNTANGLTGIIASIPYTIGYASLSNALLSGTVQASIYNREGKLIKPGINVVQSAIDNFQKEESNKIQVVKSFVEFDIINAGGIDSYPLVTLSYIVLNSTTSDGISCCSMEELVGLAATLISSSSYETIARNNLVPLPRNLSEYVRKNLLPRITCRGQSVYDNYLKSLLVQNDTMLQTWQIVLVVTAIAIIILIIIFIKYQNLRRMANENVWLLKISEFKYRIDGQGQGQGQEHESSAPENSKETFSFKAHWSKNDCDVQLTPLSLNQCSRWSHITKRLIYVLTREFRQDNLVSLLGITVSDGVPHLVNQSCPKGTLHKCLQSSPYEITMEMKYCLACDVINGLRYLHKKNVAHGFLSSATCVVDANWTVKISGWEVYATYFVEDQPKLSALKLFDNNTTMDTKAKLIQLIYSDPELKTLSLRTPYPSDVYSFGLVLIEIFTQQLPFYFDVNNSVTYKDLIHEKFLNMDLVPTVRIGSIPEKIHLIANHCLGPSKERPDVNTIYDNLNRGRSNKHGVVDIVLESMEKCIADRTYKLRNVTTRMEELLTAVLPTQIAFKLLNGETVAPELYENATIFFSDIVGFTTISARSTPLEVMNFLNNIWIIFDQTIDQFDVYKVDTIGDAYMVSSGLPTRNGVYHSKHIADLSLQLMHEAQKIKISHLDNEPLKMRMGFNSGPVTAGVIGNKMPQYCVFGDTVNTASRMESTSLPFRIQVSENSYKLLKRDFKEFQFELRGETEIKGKGKMKTYWLLNKKPTSIP